MPYPPGVNDVPDDNTDYWQDMAGCLDTAAKQTKRDDNLHVDVYSDAFGYSGDFNKLDVAMNASLLVHAYPDPSDASLEMAITLGQFWTAVAEGMLKARRK